MQLTEQSADVYLIIWIDIAFSLFVLSWYNHHQSYKVIRNIKY